MKKEEILNYAVDHIDEKYVDEAAEALFKTTAQERTLYEIKVKKTPKPKRSYGKILGLAASVAAVAGIGITAAVISNNSPDISTAGDNSLNEGQGVSVTLSAADTSEIYEISEEEIHEEILSSEEIENDIIVEAWEEYPVPPESAEGAWLAEDGGGNMYAANSVNGEPEVSVFNYRTGKYNSVGSIGKANITGVCQRGVYDIDNDGTVCFYDEKFQLVSRHTLPETEADSSGVMVNHDGKYILRFIDDNPSLKRNEKSCLMEIYNTDEETSLLKIVVLPMTTASVQWAEYNEETDELIYYGQKFAKGTDISEGFVYIYSVMNAGEDETKYDSELGEKSYQYVFDGYEASLSVKGHFIKDFDGGILLSGEENGERTVDIYYHDGKTSSFGSFVSETGLATVSENGKYLLIQGGYGFYYEDLTDSEVYTYNMYDISDRNSEPVLVGYAHLKSDMLNIVRAGNDGKIYYSYDNKLLVAAPVPPDKPNISPDEIYEIHKRADSLTWSDMKNYEREKHASGIRYYVSGYAPLYLYLSGEESEIPETVQLRSDITKTALDLRSCTAEEIDEFIRTVSELSEKTAEEAAVTTATVTTAVIPEEVPVVSTVTVDPRDEFEAILEDRNTAINQQVYQLEKLKENQTTYLSALEEQQRLLEALGEEDESVLGNLERAETMIAEQKKFIEEINRAIEELEAKAEDGIFPPYWQNSPPMEEYSEDNTLTAPDKAISLFYPVDEGKWMVTQPFFDENDERAETFGKPHYCMDIGGKGINGANVYAAEGGTVKTVVGDEYNTSDDPDKGKYIIIDHGNGIETAYYHLNAAYVKAGDTVNKGDVIGSVGNTGWSTGPHLGFALSIDGKFVNPENYMSE